MKTITCENCNQAIGNLETPCVHNDRPVCYSCKQRLIKRSGGFTDPDANTQAAKTMARVLLWVIGAIGLIALFQIAAGG